MLGHELQYTLPAVQTAILDGINDELHIGAQLYVSKAGQTIADLAIGRSHPDIDMTQDTLMPWLSANKPIYIGWIPYWQQYMKNWKSDVNVHIQRSHPTFTWIGLIQIRLFSHRF